MNKLIIETRNSEEPLILVDSMGFIILENPQSYIHVLEQFINYQSNNENDLLIGSPDLYDKSSIEVVSNNYKLDTDIKKIINSEVNYIAKNTSSEITENILILAQKLQNYLDELLCVNDRLQIKDVELTIKELYKMFGVEKKENSNKYFDRLVDFLEDKYDYENKRLLIFEHLSAYLDLYEINEITKICQNLNMKIISLENNMSYKIKSSKCNYSLFDSEFSLIQSK